MQGVKIILIASLFPFGSFALISCGTSVDGSNGSASTIYVAGTSQNQATLWTDGVPALLSSNPEGSQCYSVYLDAADVYTAGLIYGESETTTAAFWKNGVITLLTDGQLLTSASAIAATGGHTYVVGYSYQNPEIAVSNTIATIWMDGVASHLTDGSNAAQATSIAFLGTDVYVSGWEDQTIQTGPTTYQTFPAAVMWVNGVETELQGTTPSKAYGIALQGPHAIAVGYTTSSESQDQTATQWHGATSSLIQVPGVLEGSEGKSIAVNGSDIFISVQSQNSPPGLLQTAGFIKDNSYTSLTFGSLDTAAYQIVVSNSDVYVAGIAINLYDNSDKGRAGYWKNGAFVELTNGSQSEYADAFGIAVAAKQ